MSSLEDHAHAADAQLVEDQVVADEQAAALVLIQGGGLVGRQLAGLLEHSGQTEDSRGCRNVSGQAIDFVLSGQADLDHRPAKLGRVGDRIQATTRGRLVRQSGLDARPAESSHYRGWAGGSSHCRGWARAIRDFGIPGRAVESREVLGPMNPRQAGCRPTCRRLPL